MTARLFDAPTIRRSYWTGNVLPVLAPPLCPDEACRAPLTLSRPAVQPALFAHGGYGAAERITRVLCTGCYWTGTATVESVNPRHL